MKRALILPVGTFVVLLAADPLIARAGEAHPALFEFALSPMFWFGAFAVGIVLCFLAASIMLALLIADGREDAQIPAVSVADDSEHAGILTTREIVSTIGLIAVGAVVGGSFAWVSM